MQLSDILARLGEKVAELHQGVVPVWQVPGETPLEPLNAEIDPSWPKLDPNELARRLTPGMLKKYQKNWFYSEVAIPETCCGMSLTDTDAMFLIHGWLPFTLWLDGQELFKEEHAWHAAGPIAQPTPVKIVPGKKYRVVACLEPNDPPVGPMGGNVCNFRVEFKSQKCVDMAIQIGAAGAELRLGQALCKTDAERKKFLKAANLVDLRALAANDFTRTLESVEKFEQAARFLWLRAKSVQVHLVGHTHIDMDWMWTWVETVHCIRRDVKAVLDMMDDFPDLCFTHSQVPTYQVIQEMDPDLFERIKLRIAEGRWECAAGTWVEGDLNMADGESIARHMLYAKDWTRANLGVEAKVLWEPDTFGHPGNMPQLAGLGEFDQYFHWRCNPGKENNWPVRSWQGIDGSKVIATSQDYAGSLLAEVLIDHVLGYVNNGHRMALHIWGLGDHGGGLPRWHIRAMESYRHRPLIPSLQFSTMASYLAAIGKESSRFPANKGETYTLFEGCFTTHASIKKYNRQCETALLTAQTLSALAGVDTRSTLREAWCKTLFNQFHDIFDGAAVHDTYINAHDRADKAIAAAGDVIAQSLDVLVGSDPKGKVLTLVNPLGFERSEPVRVALPENTLCLLDDKGNAVPVQKLGAEFVFIARGVGAFSSKSYRIASKLPRGARFGSVGVTENARAQTFVVESSAARAQISRMSGAIGSYVDRKLGREMVPQGVPRHLEHAYTTRQDLAMNVFQVIDEAHNGMSAWCINDPVRQENLLRNATVTLVQTGPVFAQFKVEHRFRGSRIEQDVLFYQDFPRVDFQIDIDWRERGNPEVGVPQLKVSFATNAAAQAARFEGPYTVMTRPANGTEQPTQKFVDVAGADMGFTLYNDSRYGCDVLGGRARMTLLRNPYSPDPQTDNGTHQVHLAFWPHDGKLSNGELVRRGMAFNRPMLARRVRQMPASVVNPLKIQGADSVVCTCLGAAEHGDKLILRLFETSGKSCAAKLVFAQSIGTIQQINLLEKATGPIVRLERGKAVVKLKGFEVKTLLVDI